MANKPASDAAVMPTTFFVLMHSLSSGLLCGAVLVALLPQDVQDGRVVDHPIAEIALDPVNGLLEDPLGFALSPH
jgi:hypothetical protein